MRRFKCDRFPEMRIKHLSFIDGLLDVEDSEDVKMVEGNDWYGVHVFDVTPLSMQAAVVDDEPEMAPAQPRRGRRAAAAEEDTDA